ncbi:retention module-containing protein [Marinomonas arctica]|uniref:retention module-containing protein n=1 Tax=Marinomonas arctica TaxID=383750 RepID=UPI000DBA41B4|nr:retention module-containing protein [Marinomonas arctica]
MSDSQVSFATLGNAIGFITKLSGSVTVQSIDGQERVVKIGDPIFFGEIVLTGPNGSAAIAFIDGTEIVIGNDAVVEITDEVYNSGDNADLVADSSADVDALQEAILAGDDPTLIQDAPAAGEAQGFEQQRVDVDIDRNDNSALPTFGNDTLSTLPTYGYDTDNGSGGQTGQNQYSVPSSSNRTSSETTSTTVSPVAAVAGTVTVNSITSDDMINATEATSTIVVSGTAAGGDISQGDQVVLVVNGTTYTTTVSATGTWSIGVAGSDLAADTSFDVVVTSSNSSGNTVESIGTSTHTVDQSTLFVNIDIDPITEDSTINAAESNAMVTITGTVTGDEFNTGIVTVVINGVTYETQVGSDGIWSVDVAGSDLIADSDRVVEASVVVSNNIGQEGVTDTTESYLVKTGSRASISVNSITSDDVINAEESEGSVTVSGRVGFDASAGDVVSMTINGTLYTAVVLANKTWSVDVLGSDLAQDASFQASVTGQDSAGNSFSATTTSTHTVDTSADAGTVTVNAITSDDVINATEAAGTVAVTGTATGGDIAEGDSVTLVINGTTYTTTVGADNTWSVDVAGSDLAADTAFDAVVTSSDEAGNTVESTGSSTHTVDLAANANIDIGRITSDSVINSGESADGVMVSITGWVGGDAKPGDTVTITLDGEVIGSGIVSNEQNASGKYTYSIDVLGSDLANTTLANPFVTATVTGTDEAGNPFSANSTEIFKVDTFADVDVFLAENNNDGVVNFDEAGNLTVGGWLEVGGNVTSITVTDSEGQMVTLTGNIVISEDGSGWAYFETNIDVSTLADGELSVVVNVTDGYGNEGVSNPQSIVKDTVADAGTVTVNAITSDDVINAEESGQTITVSGKAVGGDISVGDVVKMTINGKEYSTTVAVGGLWTLAVAGSDLAADTEFEVVVTSSDAAGNTVESKTTSTHVVDTTAPDSLVISLNTDSGSSANDNLTNDGSYTITGIESGATLEYFVDGEWITTAPTTSEGVNTVTVRQVDSAGNTSESSTLEFTLDTVAEVAGETVSMNEDSAEPIVINILANDESGAVLVPGSVSFDSEKGTVTVNEDGTLLFTPAADFSGEVEIAYQVIDEAGNTATATATVNVTPVTDVPTVELTLEPTTTTTLYSVDLSNVLDGVEDPVGNPAGFTVIAKNSDGNVVDISIKDSGSPTGFGVTGAASNGDDSEIGKQETLVVELDKPASSATFELAWLNSHNETAVYTVKYSDGTSATFTIDGNSDEGGYDRIGDPVTVTAPEGKSILAIEFSTPTTGDRVATSDYLLHSVSYESAVTNYTVDITAAPTDTDHSENITELTVTTPEGTSLSGAEKLGTENGVTTWKISLNSGGFTNNVAIDPETGVVTVKGLVLSVPDDFDGELSVTATATAVDPGAAAVSGSATWENSAPELAFADGSDSVVISEEDLLDSDSAAANGASVTGTFSISDAEGQNLALSLVAPAEVMTSGGVTLVWTTDSSGNLVAKAGETEIIRVALTDTDGQHGYVVTLSGPVDHGDTTLEDAVTVDFGIAVNDGLATTTEYVSVSIEDSAPVAVNDEDSITVRRETFEVTGIEANWVSYQSGTNVKTFDGTSTLGGLDNDDGKDQIRWGTPASSGLQSGYGFIDNDAGLSGQFELNEDIVIGTFTHYNYPVYDNAITAASMEVSFSVTDDTGVTQPVTLKVDFDHNETPNSNDALASRDIVTVKNTFVTFEWEGEVYTLQVVGFKDINDPDGPVVTSIYTNEDAATSYELVVRVVEGEGYSLPETTGNVLEGDDGAGADALSQDGDTSVVSVAVGGLVTESDANVGSSIQGQYGNLVLNADGSYTYQVTVSVDKIPAGAQETFSYMIQDSDGSTSSATLSIDVGTNTAPVAQNDAFTGEMAQGLEISVTSLLANDTDTDGDTLTVTSVSNAQNGYAYLNSEGNVVFTPASGFTGTASFNYTVSDGNGGKDTATATLEVKAATTSANVTVSIAEINGNWDGFGSKSDLIDSATHHDYNYDQWHQFGSGNDQIVIDNDVEKWLDAGDGDNSIYVGDDVNRNNSAGIKTGSGDDDIFVKDNVDSTIQTGGGNDRVQIGYDLGNGYHSAHINLGDGDNNLIIKNDVNNYSTVHSGSGDDVVSIGDDVRYDADIQLGDGNDRLTIGDKIEKEVSINLGSGNDVLVVGGKVSDEAWVDGGSGSDSVWFESYSRSDYNSDKDGIKSRFANFENFKFSDGTVIGNASAFDGSSVSGYSVTVNISDLASDETLSSVVINGVPEGAKLQQNGIDLAVNDDGTYTVSVDSGVTSIDNLMVVSSSNSQLDDFELTASINTNGVNDDLIGTTDESVIVGGSGDDFLSGTTGEDSLLGNSGDDVLFGGNDQVSDTLTGGAGNDIFILNDTADVSNIDIITDFNAAEDALDLTDLLTGIEGDPGKDADVDAITKFLTENVKVTDGHVKVGGEDVAEFGSASSFDSNLDGSVSSTDSIKVIYNDQEYNINIDG